MGYLINPFISFPALADVFASLYESFQDLTTVQKQHFVEWFSGKALDSIWTFGDQGGGTSGMVDAIDGGYFVDSGAGFAWIAFNDKRQYSQTGSVIIMVLRDVNDANGDERWGFVRTASADGLIEKAYINSLPAQANFQLNTDNGGAQTATATSIVVDNVYHVFKVECKASSVEASIAGVLEATSTTTLPDQPLQPRIATRADLPAGRSEVRYLEAYNT